MHIKSLQYIFLKLFCTICVLYKKNEPINFSRSRLRLLYNLESDGLQSRQGFVARLRDVRRRQQEAVTPAVLELEREGVLDAQLVRPVVGAAGGQICSARRRL